MLAAALLSGHRSLAAQTIARPGSTPEGDALRGQGQYLKGMAWYELGAAQARAIDVETMAAWNAAVQAGYNEYLAARGAVRRGKAGREQPPARGGREAARGNAAPLRENPTVDDIRSGVALDALVSDLADPKIPASRWRFVAVDLPADFSLEPLVFRFAAAPGYRLPPGSGPSVVALKRMKVGDRWPISLRRAELVTEQAAYRRALDAVVDRCAKGKPLCAADVETMRDAVRALRDKADLILPAAGPDKKQADTFLGLLDEATRFFLDHGFAEELIKDVQEHEARTVAQLLGFMKKYRLLFDEADEDPAVWKVYQTLYDLLKKQKVALDLADGADKSAEPEKAAPRPR